MVIEAKEVTLNNGQKAVLKSPEVSDAKAMIFHIYKTSEETHFMARYPEEVMKKEEDMAKWLQRIRDDTRDFMLAAYVDGELVGNCAVHKMGEYIKYRHRAGFGISIQEKVCNLGLGTILVKEMLEKVKHTEFEQVELGVFSDNPRAKHVYEKMGFQEVGIQPRAFKLKDGTYRDEILMVYWMEEA